MKTYGMDIKEIRQRIIKGETFYIKKNLEKKKKLTISMVNEIINKLRVPSKINWLIKQNRKKVKYA